MSPSRSPRSGPVMALAMDAHLKKEIFPVQVIA